jgi:hypothetical protein
MTQVGEQDDTTPKRPPGSLAELFQAWRYLFLFLGLALGVVLFYAEENWRGQRAWTNYRLGMAARGEAVTAAAFVPPLASGDENFAAAPGLPQIFMGQTIAPRYDAAANTLKPRTEVRSNSWFAARTDLAAWHAAHLKPTNQVARAEAIAVDTNLTTQAAAAGVRAFLAETDSTIEKVRAASERPRSRFNLAYDQDDPAAIILRHLAPLKHLSQILKLRASAELALGQTDEAADDVQLMLRLADASREEPILISQFVRIAQLQLVLQPLAEGMEQWSDAQLREFQERLGRFDFCADGYRTLQAERVFFGCGVIEYVRRTPDKSQFISMVSSSGNRGGVEAAAALLNAAPTGWFDLEERNYSRAFADFVLPAIDLPGRQIRPAACRQGSERLTTLLNHSPTALLLRHRFFTSLLLPSLANSVRKLALGQAGADVAAVACALQRYRLANGQFPDALNSLSPQFMAKLPHDVVNGQPLRYRRTDNRHYVLYSVGWNVADDGGIVAPNKNNEPADHPRGADQSEGDWVWRPL